MVFFFPSDYKEIKTYLILEKAAIGNSSLFSKKYHALRDYCCIYPHENPKKYCPLILSKFWQNYKLYAIGIDSFLFLFFLHALHRHIKTKKWKKIIFMDSNALAC